jgi:hypothetical protein
VRTCAGPIHDVHGAIASQFCQTVQLSIFSMVGRGRSPSEKLARQLPARAHSVYGRTGR